MNLYNKAVGASILQFWIQLLF